MKTVLNAVKLHTLKFFAEFSLKMNFTEEGIFVFRNVIIVQVLDDGRWNVHLYSYTYSTLM